MRLKSKRKSRAKKVYALIEFLFQISKLWKVLKIPANSVLSMFSSNSKPCRYINSNFDQFFIHYFIFPGMTCWTPLLPFMCLPNIWSPLDSSSALRFIWPWRCLQSWTPAASDTPLHFHIDFSSFPQLPCLAHSFPQPPRTPSPLGGGTLRWCHRWGQISDWLQAVTIEATSQREAQTASEYDGWGSQCVCLCVWVSRGLGGGSLQYGRVPAD